MNKFKCSQCKNIFKLALRDNLCNLCKDDLVYRLRKRSEIRRQIKGRKSVQEGKPDRLADLLDEAADEVERLRKRLKAYLSVNCGCGKIAGHQVNRSKSCT